MRPARYIKTPHGWKVHDEGPHSRSLRREKDAGEVTVSMSVYDPRASVLMDPSIEFTPSEWQAVASWVNRTMQRLERPKPKPITGVKNPNMGAVVAKAFEDIIASQPMPRPSVFNSRALLSALANKGTNNG